MWPISHPTPSMPAIVSQRAICSSFSVRGSTWRQAIRGRQRYSPFFRLWAGKGPWIPPGGLKPRKSPRVWMAMTAPGTAFSSGTIVWENVFRDSHAHRLSSERTFSGTKLLGSKRGHGIDNGKNARTSASVGWYSVGNQGLIYRRETEDHDSTGPREIHGFPSQFFNGFDC